MPLFTTELNRLGDYIGVSTLTIRLHTTTPSNASPTAGRITVGGGLFESGFALSPGNITGASNGDISNNVDLDFGTADQAIGTVRYWSAYRSNAPVAFGTLPATNIAIGDSFRINSGAPSSLTGQPSKQI